jgi:hypothetical protein
VERKARLIANAVGQQAALRKLFERALVFPAALREHARALEETVGRIHAHARDVVVVDWQHAEQQGHERQMRLPGSTSASPGSRRLRGAVMRNSGQTHRSCRRRWTRQPRRRAGLREAAIG